jgi:hypothetical protein
MQQQKNNKKYYYSVVSKIRYSQDKWAICSYYDENNYFRGPACFTSKDDAERYLQIFKARLEKRNKSVDATWTHGNPDKRYKVPINLKIERSDTPHILPKAPFMPH